MSYVTQPLLAFGFGSPWLLSGLALAGIPLIIHLLHKRRYVEMDWAAMRFLLEATRKQSRRMRIEHFILLLVRTLVIALLVLALARPHADTATGALRASMPVHRIVVIDATMSMQFRQELATEEGDAARATQTTRFGRAKQLIRDLMQQGQRGDAWNLVRLADKEPLAIVGQPAFSTETVDDELQDLTVTDAPGDLAATLETVLSLTKLAPEMPRKEVIFVTDLQASTWTSGGSAAQARHKVQLKQLAERARLSVLNVSNGESANAAVLRLDAESALIATGRPVRLSSTVRNFGSVAMKNAVVELFVDDRLVDSKRVDLASGVDVPVDWSHTFQTGGEHKLEVRLQEDDLPLDNRRWLALPARDELRILLVDGRPSGNRREAASYYVAKALSPSTLSDSAAGLIRTHIISESELPATNLSLYDALILCNLGLMTEREATLLETFVRSGHGLLIFPGDQTNQDSYNQRLFRDGQGLLPARLEDRVSSPDRETLFGFDARDYLHPLVKAFQGNPGAGLEATLTFEFIKLKPTEDSKVALWFTNGQPALVERSVGLGRVILSATSADDRWSTWAIWAPSFVPLMHEAVTFAVGDQWRRRQLTVNEPITASVPLRAFESSAVVVRPSGTSEDITIQDQGESALAVFDDTTKVGVYTVEMAAPVNQSLLYAVNADPQESDLTPLSQQDFQTRLFADVEVDLKSQNDAVGTSESTVVSSTMSRLIRGLALCVLIGLLLEPLLAWSFLPGLIVLLAVVGLIVAYVGFVNGSGPGLVAVLVFSGIMEYRRRRKAAATNLSS